MPRSLGMFHLFVITSNCETQKAILRENVSYVLVSSCNSQKNHSKCFFSWWTFCLFLHKINDTFYNILYLLTWAFKCVFKNLEAIFWGCFLRVYHLYLWWERYKHLQYVSISNLKVYRAYKLLTHQLHCENNISFIHFFLLTFYVVLKYIAD